MRWGIVDETQLTWVLLVYMPRINTQVNERLLSPIQRARHGHDI